MDRNLVLAFALSFAVLALWMVWQGQYTRPSMDGAAEFAQEHVGEDEELRGSLEVPLSDLPEANDLAPPVEVHTAREEGEVFQLEMPLYHMELNSRGAGIQYWALREYAFGPSDNRQPVLLTLGKPLQDVTLTTPFLELGLGDLSELAFDVLDMSAAAATFQLSRGGVTVRKTFTFEPESYSFSLRVDVENDSERTVAPGFAVDVPIQAREEAEYKELALTALHQGSVERKPVRGLGKAGLLGSLSRREPQQIHTYLGDTDWAGIQTTYFLSIVMPDQPTEASARFVASDPGKAGVVEIFFEPVQLQAGQSATREFRAYMGPKEVDRLVAVGRGAVRSNDLGWSWIAPMTHFFAWMLRALYSLPFLGNYGIAIVILTLLVRVVTTPLMSKQMRSMEGMRGLQPKIKELQEKYKDDRQKQSEEMMKLYKKEGVNPLGGCLPMALQMPVMIGLFYALRSSIELREAPFFGWINDLSAPETLFMIPGLELPVRVLPLVMGVTMVLQQRMTPQPTVDAAQARMMTTVMPIVMTAVFYQFASGLVLYWMLSNVLAISHQMWIRRANTRTKPSARKPGKKQVESSS